jgi:acetylornithine deacetylase
MAKIPKLEQRIRSLIATPSISSVRPDLDQGNRAVIDLLADWLETLAFDVEIQTLPNNPEKANLIATLGRGPGGLVLSGHTDTVPYDAGRWKHDPFAGREDGGRIYGLGSADMKSFLAIAIEAARQFEKKDLACPLILLATADEECSMDGARALVDAGRPKARFAVIGEPTGLKPVRTHKGILMEAIRLTGHSGHSSNPAFGNSALEGMHRVLDEILAWREELQAKYRNPLFAVPVPTLNLGHIHGGDSPNRICAHCELHIDLRPLPGMDLEELRAALRARLSARMGDSGLGLEVVPLVPGVSSVETRADSPIVRAAESLTGHGAGSVAFATEAPFLDALGMETVVLGPGHIDQAHQPDEYLALDMIQPSIDLLSSLIQQFCVEGTQAPEVSQG